MSEEDGLESAKEQVQKALVNTTRIAGSIATEDLDFFRASDPSGGKELDKQNGRLLDLAKNLLKSVTAGTDIATPRLPNAEAVDDNWSSIVEVIDNLLEKADVALDEYTGVIKRLTPTEDTQVPNEAVNTTSSRRVHSGPKPQLLFNNPPTNNETTAFKPLLKSKPHAVASLKDSLNVIESGESKHESKHLQ